MPALVIVTDTSASTQDVIDALAAELRGIQEECQPEEIIVIMADAAVHRVDHTDALPDQLVASITVGADNSPWPRQSC